MPLQRTNTIGLQDLVAMVTFDTATAAAPDRLLPVPFDGFVERIYLQPTGQINTTGYLITVRQWRDGVQITTDSLEIPAGSLDGTLVTYNYDPVSPDFILQTGDVLDFDSTAAGATTENQPVTATVVLRRV